MHVQACSIKMNFDLIIGLDDYPKYTIQRNGFQKFIPTVYISN